jgi:hypothetical protein
MSTKEKWFDDKQQAAAKLWADVGSNNVKVYDIDDDRLRGQADARHLAGFPKESESRQPRQATVALRYDGGS